MQIIGDC